MHNDNQRITLSDNKLTAVLKVVEGNPGAVSVISELYKHINGIDPLDAFAAFCPAFTFDSHGIYGSEIWRMYKDVCGQNLIKLVGILRAEQLGIVPEAKDLRGEQIIDALRKVKERLPEFCQVEPYASELAGLLKPLGAD